MPGWQLTDQQTWQLVSYIRNLPKVAATTSPPQVHVTSAHYVGSAACSSCHQTLYDHWKKTLMANVVRNPTEHPDAIIPDLSKPNPLVTFTAADIAFVYGSKWKQHTHHKAGSPGSECIACHMPKIAQTLGDVNVRSHTFRFVYPAATDSMRVPNACNVCHTDKTTAWATEALKTWKDRSPWRAAQ